MGEDVWTVKRISAWIEGYLGEHGDDNARVSAQWLVSEALGMSRMQLFLDPERPLTPDERGVLRDWTRRRAAGEPLQYITGEVGFRHITLKVREGVLIPRPETEVLVSEALSLLPAAPKPQDAYDEQLIRRFVELGGELNGFGGNVADGDDGGSSADGAHGPDGESSRYLVADICTGSGCIACSLASEHPLVHVVATDLSPIAVSLARENVAALGIEDRVDVLECDLGSGIDPTLLGTFDLVVSNPPYVPTSVLSQLPDEVGSYEPFLALDGGEDGLDVFRRLLAWCARALSPGGAFAFELHETCLEAASAEAARWGFTDIRTVNDLTGRPRVLTARWGETL